MIIDVDFTESNATFDVDFGEVTQLGNPVLIRKEITENGEYRASEDGASGYSSVSVDVPIPDGYIIPDGEITITENGTHNVREYATAIVDVISGEYDIEATYNDDGTQSLAIVDKNGSGADRCEEEFLKLIERRATGDYYNNKLVEINVPMFYGYPADSGLKSVTLPNVTRIRTSQSFYNNKSVERVSLPLCTSIASQDAFTNCSALIELNVPSLKSIAWGAFSNTPNLKKLVFQSMTSAGGAFSGGGCGVEVLDFHALTETVYGGLQSCKNLHTLIIRTPSVCKAGYANPLSSSLIANGEGYIYVPDELVEEYKVATNWTTYANQIKPISELPEEVTE